MFSTPTSQTALRRHALSFLFALSLPFFAKADLGVTFQMNQDGSQVTADVLVYNFTDILSMQFGMQWDPSQMEFVSVTDYGLINMDATNFGTTEVSEGKLLHAWWDPGALLGVTMSDCSSIFRITFNSINGQISPITINSDVMYIEVYNAQSQIVTLTQNLGCGALGKASGKIFKDNNDNCTNDGDDLNLEGWQIKFVVDKLPYYATTDANGNYSINCPAGYCEATVLFPNDGHIWEACQPVSGFQLAENEEIELTFGTHDLGPVGGTSDVFDSDKIGYSVKIAPNPVKSSAPINLDLTAETPQLLSFQIFGTSGRLMDAWQQQISAGTAQMSTKNTLVPGLYLLKVSDEDGKASQSLRLMVY